MKTLPIPNLDLDLSPFAATQDRTPPPSSPSSATLSVLIGHARGDAWSLTLGSGSWCTEALAKKLDSWLSVYPVRRPDFRELDRAMAAAGATYQKEHIVRHLVQLQATGPAALVLAKWLDTVLLMERRNQQPTRYFRVTATGPLCSPTRPRREHVADLERRAEPVTAS